MAPSPVLSTALISTDPDIASRLAAPAIELTFRSVTDDEAQMLMARTGIAPGFVRVGGRFILAKDLDPLRGDHPTPGGT